MKCPLLRHQYVKEAEGYKSEWADCLEEECAWWDGDYNQCHIATSSKSLDIIEEAIQELVGKMPHVEQFKK